MVVSRIIQIDIKIISFNAPVNDASQAREK